MWTVIKVVAQSPLHEVLDLRTVIRLEFPHKKPAPDLVELFGKVIRGPVFENGANVRKPKAMSARLKSEKYGEILTSDEVYQRLKKVEAEKKAKEDEKIERIAKRKQVKIEKANEKKRKIEEKERKIEEKKEEKAKKKALKNDYCELSSDEEELDENLLEFECEENEEESEGESNAFDPKQCQPGDFVIVNYTGQKFPGKVVEVLEDGLRVSCFEKALLSWRWPARDDCGVYEWPDVVCKIKTPIGNKRNQFRVPELDIYCV